MTSITHADADWATVRQAVLYRSQFRCELCGRRIDPGTLEAHHRLTRRFGPDCPCNVLALCQACHTGRVHGEPAAARDAGWIVSKHHRGDPGSVPVSLVAGDVWLACVGTYTSVITNVITEPEIESCDDRCNHYAEGMPTQRLISVRVSDAADQLVTATATRNHVSRTDAVRALLSIGAQHPDDVDKRLTDMKLTRP